MRSLAFAFGVGIGVAMIAGCGSTVVTGSGGSGGGTTSSSTGMGTSSASTGGGVHGDCMTNADCGSGMCVPITPGGYLICVDDPMQATTCPMGSTCCTASDCTPNGGCYEAMDLQFCGGAQLGGNGCAADACQKDSDCTTQFGPGLCTPSGAFGLPKRQCLAGFCRTDADCNAKPGGACMLVGENPCCSHDQPNGLGCVYPGDCVKNADCGGTNQCQLDTATGGSHCTQGPGGCPG
jgi:hypothetical protein